MLILGVDVETTGLDPKTNEIIEIGAVLFDSDKKQPIHIFSELITGKIPISEEIRQLTGITNRQREIFGIPMEMAEILLAAALTHCEAICAHNAPFDRSFLETHVKIFSVTNKTWIDTMADIDYPPHIGSRRLSYIAADHGFVNPFSHRALFDVMTMLNVLSAYELPKVIENALCPKIEIMAHVLYENREKAKKLGYRWENRLWSKVIRENRFNYEEELAASEGFKITILGK